MNSVMDSTRKDEKRGLILGVIFVKIIQDILKRSFQTYYNLYKNLQDFDKLLQLLVMNLTQV